MIRNRKQNRIFTARVCGQPDIAHGCRVAQARVEGDEFCAIGFGFDDALGVRVEIMSRFEVTRNQQDDSRIGIVWAGAVLPKPEVVARARRR